MSMGQLLIAEVEAGRLNYIQGYIDDGAPLNDKDSKGMTALMYAARNNDSDMVELLLKAGADPLPRDDVGDDALSNALQVIRDIDEVAKITDMLMEYGARPSLVNKCGYSAEYYAHRHSDDRLTNIINAHFAKREAEKEGNSTPTAKAKPELDKRKHHNLRNYLRRK